VSFEAAEQIANAVLYEGYLLYPYRASSLKNRFRWQFGVVAPRVYAEVMDADPWAGERSSDRHPGALPPGSG
jgi:hypothetical protein